MKKRVLIMAMRTAHTVSSMTTTPPEPSIVPAACSPSKDIGREVSVTQGALAPPGITAFRPIPLGMPPAISMSSPSEVPRGAS